LCASFSKIILITSQALRLPPNGVVQPHMGGCTGERYGWKFIPEVENIIAFIEGQARNLAGDRNIDR
jgi:hypothetical protein